MTERYEKFEEWMVGERVHWEGSSHYAPDSGVVRGMYYGGRNTLNVYWDATKLVQWVNIGDVTFEKDNKVEKYIPKVGDKVKGFKFDEGTDGVGYNTTMDDYVEEVGEVVDVYADSFVVQFPDSFEWMYPTSLAHLAKIKESTQEILHEDSQIDWEAGQVVWDVVYGKGVVSSVVEDDFFPVKVKFDDGGHGSYTLQGIFIEDGTRTLFFSEPKIEAELFPPKKPFVPVLKEGDGVVAWFEDGTKYFITIREETATAVIDDNGDSFFKSEVRFLKIGEEIKF